jgi:hypothetical protein
VGTLKSNVVACPDLHKSLHKISCAEKAGKGLIVPKPTEQRLGWFGPGLERGNGTGRISPKRPDWITAEAADPQEPLDTEKIARSRPGSSRIGREFRPKFAQAKGRHPCLRGFVGLPNKTAMIP